MAIFQNNTLQIRCIDRRMICEGGGGGGIGRGERGQSSRGKVRRAVESQGAGLVELDCRIREGTG